MDIKMKRKFLSDSYSLPKYIFIAICAIAPLSSFADSNRITAARALQPYLDQHSRCLQSEIMSTGSKKPSIKITPKTISTLCHESRKILQSKISAPSTKKFEKIFVKNYKLMQDGKITPRVKNKNKAITTKNKNEKSQ
jgi:hypothetical protein